MRETLIIGLGGDHPVLAEAVTRTASRVVSSPDHSRAPLPPGQTIPIPSGRAAAVPPDHTGVPFAPSQTCSSIPLGEVCVPDDLFLAEDLDMPGGPRFVSEQDQWDAELDELLGRDRFSAVDAREWEEWNGVDQDDAERTMLRRDAPAWVDLPPGGALAVAVEQTRPQAMSPVPLIELLKACTRESGWIEAVKVEAMASFYRQRQAEHATSPRPTQYDTKGRPIDPERSWYAEIALALGLSEQTVARKVTTALRLTSTLRATQTALKCGALTWGKALAIAEATADLPDQAAQAVEAHVLKRAAAQTHKNLLESLRRQVAKHRATEDADDHRAAVADRTCKIVPLANGMAGLWIVHTADKIQQMWVTIQAMATLAKRGTTTKQAPTDTEPTDTTSADTAAAATATPTSTTPTATAPAGTTPDGATPARTTPHGAAPTATTPTDTASARTAGATPPTANPTPTPATSTTPEARSAADGTDSTADTAAAATAPGIDVTTEPVKDARSAGQRRADVTADLFEHILRNGLDWLARRLPDQHRRRPHIEVIIPATTLLGLDDDPAELTGYGPIPAEMARRIATNGTWRRLLTDPVNGTVLEASTTRHDPGTLITETLLARHPVCAWPGCNRTSRDCDRDHTTPFKQSRTTSLTGLAPYCEYHHVIKDTPTWGWTTTSHPDGSITLTTPTGHRYTTVPPARGPITQQPGTSPSPIPSHNYPGSHEHRITDVGPDHVPRRVVADDPPPF
ncbi:MULTISPECIES: HNH endonuclease signature motif containing protein [unclassified Kribbella]|uniref:HNH endonuclease signature motif containing protein n=1 Tax=unclassified Kribbella TaxID=2644121 RepID=UPI003016F8DD